MARPKKTRNQLMKEYPGPIKEITLGVPLRTIAKEYKIGVSTCQRLKKKLFN